MPKDIGTIKHPVFKSIEAAGVAFTAITIILGGAIALTNPKDKSAYKFGVYASLIGTGADLYFQT